MVIIGIGVDIVKNQRISSAIKKKLFINRTFSKNEILISKKVDNKIRYFSKRFAAKEAFAKALGTGFRDGLSFKDIEVANDKLGKPRYIVSFKIATDQTQNLLNSLHFEMWPFNFFIMRLSLVH